MRRYDNDKRGGIYGGDDNRSYWEHGVALCDRNNIGGKTMSKKELNQWRDSLTFAERARLRKAIEKLGEGEQE